MVRGRRRQAAVKLPPGAAAEPLLAVVAIFLVHVRRHLSLLGDGGALRLLGLLRQLGRPRDEEEDLLPAAGANDGRSASLLRATASSWLPLLPLRLQGPRAATARRLPPAASAPRDERRQQP